ncbi:Imm8 family immunity protein [Ruegeria sp. SCPT10]|uniref:Imm8 family immunity protein n=1 Tax=Ruegeria sp. SCP10 TaxID=3141377 RepID=UPI00333837F9
MEAELKSLTSSDIDERVYWPDDEELFGFTLDATIGPKGEDSGNIFQFFVCTPKWITTKMINPDFGDFGLFGRELIIVKEYDFFSLKAMISELCSGTSGKDWAEVANKLSRYAAWEYADFQS